MKKLVSYIRDGKFEEMLGCVAIFVVIIPVIINIINRTFLDKYSTPIEATALLAYVWIGYGFFGYMYKKDSHVEVKFLTNMMSPKVYAVFNFIRDVLICGFCCYMCYWGAKLFSTNINRYVTGTHIPLAVGYASVAFGYGSGAIRSFFSLIGRFCKKNGKEKPEE